MRDPSAIDYSGPIFDWLRNSRDDALKKWESIITGELQQKQRAILGNVTPSKLPNFKAVDMHKTRFCDLRFQLGAGYLYCHQVQPFLFPPFMTSKLEVYIIYSENHGIGRMKDIWHHTLLCWYLLFSKSKS